MVHSQLKLGADLRDVLANIDAFQRAAQLQRMPNRYRRCRGSRRRSACAPWFNECHDGVAAKGFVFEHRIALPREVCSKEPRISKVNKAVKDENGWAFTTKTGLYGTDYLMRALVTAIGLGANRPQDAVYPTSQKDAHGRKYSGANKYVMHFAKGQLPPVSGFWSLTMYDGSYFFVNNPLNRYSISARQNLKSNPDGSTDLYIQNESPGKEKEANWLPAPPGDFILMLRLYWPNEKSPSIINGSWKISAVIKAS